MSEFFSATMAIAAKDMRAEVRSKEISIPCCSLD